MLDTSLLQAVLELGVNSLFATVEGGGGHDVRVVEEELDLLEGETACLDEVEVDENDEGGKGTEEEEVAGEKKEKNCQRSVLWR